MATNKFKVTRAQDGKSFAGKVTSAMVRGTLVRISPASIAGQPGVFNDLAQLIAASGVSRAGVLERDVIAADATTGGLPLANFIYGDDILTPAIIGNFVSARNVQEYEVEGDDLIQLTGVDAIDGTTPVDTELSTIGGKLCLRGNVANKTISGNTVANPSVVTTTENHGLITGQTVVISGSNSTPSLNGSRVVTVISPTTFSVPVNVTNAGTAGSVQVPHPELFGYLRGQLAPESDDNDFRLLVEVCE